MILTVIKSIVLFCFGLLLTFSCKQERPDWIDRAKHEGLHKLTISKKFETYATEDNPNNLQNTVRNLELAKEYFDKVFDENLNFAVLFVDNKNWDKYAFAPPHGMPQSDYEGNIVLGLGKSMMATRYEAGLKSAPEQQREFLQKHYGKEINLDLFFRDALSLHELGHLYQFYRTGKNSQRRWINELFGNLCQIAAVRNFEDQNTFHQMDSFQEFLIKADHWGELRFKSLDQFEENYFEVMKEGRNYGWYQTHFYLAARVLYSKYGDSILVRVRNFLIKTSVDKIGKLDDNELHKMMIKEFGDDVVNELTWKYGA